MGDLAKNLSRHEIACSCDCGFDPAVKKLTGMIQATVDHFQDRLDAEGLGGKVALQVTSGARCLEHNEDVQKEAARKNGGVYKPHTSRSLHMSGLAMDIKLFIKMPDGSRTQIPPCSIFNVQCSMWPDRYGFIQYETFNHADIRPIPYHKRKA